MTPLLWRSSRRFLARHPGQVALTILGVALGVGVGVAIDLANQSALRGFVLSQEALAGRTTHAVTGGTAGLPAGLISTLRSQVDELVAAPVLDDWAELTAGDERRGVEVLGVDPISESQFDRTAGFDEALSLDLTLLQPGETPIVLSRSFAGDLGVELGSALQLTTGGAPAARADAGARVVGLLEPPDRLRRAALDGVVVTPLAAAQRLFGREARLSRIELIVPEGAPGEAQLAAIERLLPVGAELSSSARRTATSLAMTRAFRLNLTALGLLALVCGLFLVYQTVSFAVVQRVTTLGIYRMLGVTRREILALVLGEASALGVVGVALGVGLGVLLANLLLVLVTRTLDDLYFSMRVRELVLSPAVLARSGALGLAGTLVAAARPALEASRTEPVSIARRSLAETRSRNAAPRLAGLGAALVACGVAVLIVAPGVLTAFGGLQLAVVGAALGVPAATLAIADRLAPISGRVFGAIGRLSARGVAASLSRTGVATAALTVAVAVTLGVGAMIGSFRIAVEGWLAGVLVSDVYLRPVGNGALGPRALPDDLLGDLVALPGVARVNTVRRLELEDDARTRLVVLEIDRAGFLGYHLVHGRTDEAWPAFRSGAVLVSEAYGRRLGLAVGDHATLRTDRGRRQFPIAGVVTDFASDQGIVMIYRRVFERHWLDRVLSGASLIATGEESAGQLVEQVRRLVAARPDRRGVLVQSSRELREASLEVFDRTFTITRVLRLLLGTVAFVGVLGALMALQLERRREWALLRAEGMTPRQLGVLITAQTGLLGLLAGVFSIPLGAGLAAAMVYVVNRRSFGWSMDLVIGPELVAEGIVLALAAALAAGLVPAWLMTRAKLVTALREE